MFVNKNTNWKRTKDTKLRTQGEKIYITAAHIVAAKIFFRVCEIRKPFEKLLKNRIGNNTCAPVFFSLFIYNWSLNLVSAAWLRNKGAASVLYR